MTHVAGLFHLCRYYQEKMGAPPEAQEEVISDIVRAYVEGLVSAAAEQAPQDGTVCTYGGKLSNAKCALGFCVVGCVMRATMCPSECGMS